MIDQDLKNAGLKVTGPRIKILALFESSPTRHLSAENVYQQLKDMGEDASMATVYRVLTQFEKAGLLVKHTFEDHAVFELNLGEHHDHLVCVKCGKVEEFVDEEIERRQKAIAQKTGFKMTDHVLHIYGLCPRCQS